MPNRIAVTILCVALASAACGGAPLLKEGDAVIITDFTNTTGDAMFDASLRQIVHVTLQQSPFLNVVPDLRVFRALRAAKKPIDQLTSNSALDVCAAAGATAVVAGTITAADGKYPISLDLIDCATRARKTHLEMTANTRQEIIARTGEATTRLRELIGEPEQMLATYNVTAANALTASIDALRPFAMGTRIRSVQGEDAAGPFFERAVQLDPNFTAAWAKLGVVAANAGHYDGAINATKKAYELRARTTEFERLYIDWNYAAHITRDHAAVKQALDKLAATYPRDFAVYNNLGVALTGVGDLEGALSAYQRAAALAPAEPILAVNIAYTQLFLGRRDEANRQIDGLLQKRADPNLAIARWHSAVLAGDAKAAAYEQEAAKFLPPPQLLMARATVAAWRGQLREFGTMMAEMRRLATEAKSAEAAHGLEAAERQLRAAYDRGPAIAALEAGVKNETVRPIMAQTASVLAGLGRVDAAKALVAKLETEPLDSQPVFLSTSLAKAYIRAAAGQTKEAVADVNGLMAEFPHALDLHFHLGRTRELAGDLTGAARSYRVALQVMPQLGLNPQIVPVRLFLSNVLSKQGDAPGAKEQMDALRAQWKDKDTDFALAREVR